MVRQQCIAEALQVVEQLLLERGPTMKSLKKGKVKMDPEEREQAMAAGACWHHGPPDATGQGAETCAIWKSVVNGKTWYACNTHRCYQAKPTLKGAIRAFKFVKTTA